MQRRFVATAAMLGLFVSSTFGLAAAPAPENAKPGYLGVLTSKAEDGQKGAWIREVTPDSPAAKAGLQNGDIVTKVGDREVKDVADLTSAIAEHKAGSKVMLWVMRDGKERQIEATLGERPGRKLPALGNVPMPAAPRGAYLGIHTQELTPELKDRLKLKVEKGVMVTEVMPDTPAAKAGLKSEDVILAVGDKQVNTPEELREIISGSKAGSEVVLHLQRGDQKMECRCTLGEMPMPLDFQAFQNQLPDFFRGRFEDGQFPFKFDLKDLTEGRLPMEIKKFSFDLSQVQEMQKKIEELEKRIAELEKQRK